MHDRGHKNTWTFKQGEKRVVRAVPKWFFYYFPVSWIGIIINCLENQELRNCACFYIHKVEFKSQSWFVLNYKCRMIHDKVQIIITAGNVAKPPVFKMASVPLLATMAVCR